MIRSTQFLTITISKTIPKTIPKTLPKTLYPSLGNRFFSSQNLEDPTFINKCLNTLKSISLGTGEVERSFPFATAKEIAQEYILDDNYANNNEKRIEDLISWERSKTMGSGFITGVGGILSLPIGLPAALLSSLVFQARLSGSIAEIRGYDTHRDDVQTAVIVSLMGSNINKITQDINSQLGHKTFTEFGTLRLPLVGMAAVQRMVIKEVAKQGSIKAGTRGGARALPILGGVVGSLVDAHSLEKTKDNALKIFSDNNKKSSSSPTTINPIIDV